jgi:hypothetical protein
MRIFVCMVLSYIVMLATVARGDEPGSKSRPVPPTRPEMKQYLENLKAAKPRIPVPELTGEEKAKLGDRAADYEARLRSVYLPAGETRSGFGFSREPDPNMSLDYTFKTELFWIVSRTNNCHY